MIPKKMYAVLTYGSQDMRYEQIDVPTPGPGELLVRVTRVGMGINDPAIYEGDWPMLPPLHWNPRRAASTRLNAAI